MRVCHTGSATAPRTPAAAWPARSARTRLRQGHRPRCRCLWAAAPSRRIGQGFQMSKTRNAIRPSMAKGICGRHSVSASHCPATSSMTTICGSLRPLSRATRVAAGMPTAVAVRSHRKRNHRQQVQRHMTRHHEPHQRRGDRAVRSWPGLQQARAEERADGPRPWRSSSLAIPGRSRAPRSSSRSGSSTGDVIL